MNRLSILSVILCGLLFWGCDKPQQEEPDVPQEPVVDFVLEVSDITATSCHFSVVPKDDQMSYVVMLVPKADFDSYEDEYKYQDDDLEWFTQKAIEEGKDLAQWLEGFLKKGPFEADEEGLMPGESYYLYAYGLDYEGYFTTGVTKKEFATPEIQQTDLSFEIDVTDIGLTKATVKVQASDDKAVFFMNVFSKEQYEQWGGGEVAFSNHAQALVDYYVTMGRTPEEMVTNLGSVGRGELVFDDLTDDTEYIAYAVGIDENFFVNSKATVVNFRTKKVVESSITFEIDIRETTYCSVIGTVTPSNADQFICAIQPKAQLEQFESDQDIMYELVATYQQWDAMEDVLYAGEAVELEPISSLSPSTEYVVLCFGWDEAPTTGLTKTEFVTLAEGGNPRAQEMTFALSDIIHNKVTVNITPKLGLHYFYDCMSVETLNEYIVSEGSEDEAICRFIDERIDYGAEFFNCTRKEYLEDMGAALGKQRWTFTGLEEDSEYIIVAATVNMTTGKIALRKPFKSDVFRTTILIESDAAVTFVIDKYYDGTELAELDPVQFSKCKGMVMVPYKIVPNADAVHWRTTFTYGEFASWAERDDILFELDYKCDEDKTQGFAVVHYGQVVAFLGMAENEEGYTGPYTVYEFTAQKGGASPAREFIDSLK
ncbi:MAG: hypothetical protein J6Q63_06535 [Bacteroidales bacterium]|nr:hypothetical protein [Bacteroidales bacterium]